MAFTISVAVSAEAFRYCISDTIINSFKTNVSRQS